MSSIDKKTNPRPKKSPEKKIRKHLDRLEKEIGNNEFISAYNQLKKAQTILNLLPITDKRDEIKKKYQELNNELNLKIIKFMEDQKKKPGYK